MQTGEVEANLVKRNEKFQSSYIPDLIARKLGGEEKSVLEDAEIEFYRQERDRLINILEDASFTNHLPSNPKQRLLLRFSDKGENVICELGASQFGECVKKDEMKKLVKSSNKYKANKMIPSDQQQLKAHLKAVAEIFYRNTDPTELKSFESIEKSLRQKMLEESARTR